MTKKLACGVVVIHALLLGFAAWRDSPTVDEPLHLSSGWHMLIRGDFAISPGNPSLCSLVAAVPFVVLQPDVELVGAETTGAAMLSTLPLARLACVPFSLLGAVMCYLWAKELYGDRSALLATCLWCFSPNILAHGHLITCDVAATSMGFALLYCFRRWLLLPTWSNVVLLGCVLGLTELTKFIWLLLFSMLPAIWVLQRTIESYDPKPKKRHMGHESVMLVCAVLICMVVINAGFGFANPWPRLGDLKQLTASFGVDLPMFMERWYVGLPSDYIRGITDIDRVLVADHRSYLNGQWQASGWSYYYLFGFLVKSPIGYLALLALSTYIACAKRRIYGLRVEDELFILLPLVVIVGFVSFTTASISHHFRYVLPALPFAFLSMSRLLARNALRSRLVSWATVALTVFAITSSLFTFPHSLSYFNEIVGGPRNGWRHMVDSNFDWGQDVGHLKRWLDQNPSAGKINLAYMGNIDPKLLQIDYQVPYSPANSRSDDEGRLEAHTGWYAISANFLAGLEFHAPNAKGGHYWFRSHSCEHFRQMPEHARAGYSIVIFHVSNEQAEELSVVRARPLR